MRLDVVRVSAPKWSVYEKRRAIFDVVHNTCRRSVPSRFRLGLPGLPGCLAPKPLFYGRQFGRRETALKVALEVANDGSHTSIGWTIFRFNVQPIQQKLDRISHRLSTLP